MDAVHEEQGLVVAAAVLEREDGDRMSGIRVLFRAGTEEPPRTQTEAEDREDAHHGQRPPVEQRRTGRNLEFGLPLGRVGRRRALDSIRSEFEDPREPDHQRKTYRGQNGHDPQGPLWDSEARDRDAGGLDSRERRRQVDR